MTDPTAAILSSFSSALEGHVARAAAHVVSVHSHRSRASGFVWKPGLVVTATKRCGEGEVSIQLANGTTSAGHIVWPRSHHRYRLAAFDASDIAPVELSTRRPCADRFDRGGRRARVRPRRSA